ncbi:uncharacterized protein V1516DRAFT_403345 [Lipomyces oligophaga]|uniref:uncharacterized protein n=1 Tax=Lipomyces oligophaga TaxID=45792 RepID=UPI0034CD9D88
MAIPGITIRKAPTAILTLFLLTVILLAITSTHHSAKKINQNSILAAPSLDEVHEAHGAVSNTLYKIGTCDMPSVMLSDDSIIVPGSLHYDLSGSRIVFAEGHYFNPSLLATPAGSPFPYVGFARFGVGHVHKVAWCTMVWKRRPITKKHYIECESKVQYLAAPRFQNKPGTCVRIPFLALDQGLTDPRVFYSPFGEPLMLIGTNSHVICLGQYVIDLRALIPELGEMLHIENVPIRYPTYTELTRPLPLSEIDKNFIMYFDLNNEAYVAHDLSPKQVISSVERPVLNVADGKSNCIADLTEENVHAHQATTALRVTLCAFPCIPTEENTVLIAIVHNKYESPKYPDVLYRRYLIVMNPNPPFNILARSRHLVFTGVNSNNFIFAVSLAWDFSKRTRPSWKEYEAKFAENDSASMKRRKAKRSIVGASQKLIERREEKPTTAKKGSSDPDAPMAWAQIADVDQMIHKMPLQYSNPIASDFFHGWLDDVIMVNYGVADQESASFHSTARQLLECLIPCGDLPEHLGAVIKPSEETPVENL